MTCLIATMRSGSTAYAEMIAKDDKEILQQMNADLLQDGEHYDRELFDFFYHDYHTHESRFHHYTHLEVKPLVKIIPGLCKSKYLNYFLENEICIFLDRRNKLEQFLSYGIAKYTGAWSTHYHKTIEVGALEFLYADFVYFKTTIDEFYKVAKDVTYYEDINFNKARIQKNSYNKEKLFSNFEEIEGWVYDVYN